MFDINNRVSFKIVPVRLKGVTFCANVYLNHQLSW